MARKRHHAAQVVGIQKRGSTDMEPVAYPAGSKPRIKSLYPKEEFKRIRARVISEVNYQRMRQSEKDLKMLLSIYDISLEEERKKLEELREKTVVVNAGVVIPPDGEVIGDEIEEEETNSLSLAPTAKIERLPADQLIQKNQKETGSDSRVVVMPVSELFTAEKRGPGRPRKAASPAPQNPQPVKNRKRGRPRKDETVNEAVASQNKNKKVKLNEIE